jgi:hypothetical protein
MRKLKEFSLAAVQKHLKENALSQSHLLRFSHKVSCSPITVTNDGFRTSFIYLKINRTIKDIIRS